MDRAAQERKSQNPGRSPSRLVAELVPLLLVVGSLAGALTLIVAAHRRPVPLRKPSQPSASAVLAQAAPPPAPEVPAPPPQDEQPPPPPEDLTPKEVARLEALAAAERDAIARADRGLEALRRARERTAAIVDKLDRSEQTVRSRAEALEDRAVTIESEAENLAIDRDILTKNRTLAKAALDRDRQRSRTAHAIQPFKGPNGSWRRPIAIECTADQVKLQPDGPSFGLMDLSPLLGIRGNPFLTAVARETMRAQQGPTPDRAPSVPYILFVVRPDGIRAYYEALARLEPIGLAFGYELVSQDWDITYPDPTDQSDWDHSEPAPERWPTSRPLATGPDLAGSTDLPRTLADLESQARRGPYATDSDGKPVLFPGGLGGREAIGSGPGAFGGRSTGGDELGEFGAGESPGARPGFAANSPAWQGQGPRPLPSGGRGFGTSVRDGQDRFVPPNGTDLASRGFGSFARGGGGLNSRPQAGTNGGGGLGGAGGQPWNGPGNAAGADGGSENVGGGTGRSGGSSSLASGGSVAGTASATGGSGGSGSSGRSGGGSSGSGGGSGAGGSGSGSSNVANLTLGSGTKPPPSMPPNPSRNQPGNLAGGSANAGATTPTKPAGDPPKGEGNADGPKIEHGIELVIVCESKGVIIHPGAYRLSHAAIKGKDASLVKALRTIVDAKQLAEPTLKWVPRIRFLVEPGGHRTLWSARGELFAEGLDWPTSVQTSPGLAMRPQTQEVR